MTEASTPTLVQHEFQDPQACARALADLVEARVRAAVAERGVASLIVPGGSTPRLFFVELSKRSLPWKQVFVTLSDERWVENSHPDSNAAQLRHLLLQEAAKDANFIPLRREGVGLEESEGDIRERLGSMPRPFDLTLLGMGSDGHTASLFPHASGLEEALDLSRESMSRVIHPRQDSPKAVLPRITLSLKLLLDTRDIALLFGGSAKRKTFEQALGSGGTSDMPVRAIFRHAGVPVQVYCSRQ